MIRPKLFSKSEEDGLERGEKRNEISSYEKVVAACFYGGTSLAVIFTNKFIMSGYSFPYFDFLALVQFLATTFVLTVLVMLKRIDIPPLNVAIFREIFPVAMMFLGNVICGLGSTRSLNLPMFTALRRFSIFMTMCAEYLVLSNRPATQIVVSVLMMVGGAFFAALYDLTFDAYGYALVFFNNVFTALNGVYLKKATISGKCNKMGILYYNSLFSALVMLVFFVAEHVHVATKTAGGGVGVGNGGAAALGALRADAKQAALRRPVRLAVAASSNSSSTYGIGGSGGGVGAVSAGGASARRFRRALAEVAQNAATAAAAASGNKGPPTATGPAAAAAAGGGGGPAGQAATPVLESTLSKIARHDGWRRWDFLVFFVSAAFMGSVLNYSIFVCTTVNSALTTAVVGCLKNVATTYIGMVMFPDYAFNWPNFVGINVSIFGSLYYTYITLFKGLQGFGGG